MKAIMIALCMTLGLTACGAETTETILMNTNDHRLMYIDVCDRLGQCVQEASVRCGPADVKHLGWYMHTEHRMAILVYECSAKH